MKSPAFQFYPKDYFGSARVAELSLEEEGAYNRALYYCWLNDSLPSDPERLARVIGKGCSIAIATLIATLFIRHPQDIAKLIHERLELEKKKQENYHNNQQKAGKRGAKKRWGKPDRQEDNSDPIISPLAENSSAVSSLHIASPVSKLQTTNKESPTPFQKISQTAEILETEKPDAEKIAESLKAEVPKKEKKSAAQKEKLEIVLPWNTESFEQAWEGWRRYRRQTHNFRYKTSDSEQAALKHLSEISNHDEEMAIKIIQQSIASGKWEGLFPLHEKINKNHGGNGKINPDTFAADLAAVCAR